MLPGVPKQGAKQESPISASAQAKEILQRLSGSLGVRKIDLLDHALKALDQYVAHHNGRLLLPLRFNETFRVNVMPLPGEMTLRMPPRAQQESGSEADRDRTQRPVRRAVRKG